MNQPQRPSLIMITYEQESFVRAALRSMLAQDCAPSEILIADDCSKDGTFAIVEEEVARYDGPHDVRAIRHEPNKGPDNLLFCLDNTSGSEIVIFHGDDVATPDRARRLLETLEETGASLVGSNVIEIDSEDKVLKVRNEDAPSAWLQGTDLAVSGDPRMLGGALAYRREIIDSFPKFGVPRSWGVTDQILPLRASVIGGVYYLDEQLMQFRRHATNLGSIVTDRNKPKLVDEETRAANFILMRVTMLDDMNHFIREHDETSKAEAVREALESTIHARLLEWSQQRTLLMASGQRPTWVDRQTLLAARKAKQTQREKDGTRSFFRKAMGRIGASMEKIGARLR